MAGGPVAIFISAVSMMVIFVVYTVELHQENHPDFLLAVIALSSLMFATFMGLMVNLYGFQAQAEERLRRWINLLERLNLLSPKPTQTLVPARILGELLEVMRTLFPDAVGLETRLAGNQ